MSDPSAPSQSQCTLSFTFEDFTRRLHDHYQLWQSDKPPCWSDGDNVTIRDRNTGRCQEGVYLCEVPDSGDKSRWIHRIKFDGQSPKAHFIEEIHTLPRITMKCGGSDNDALWCRFQEALRVARPGYTLLFRRTDPNTYEGLVSWGGWAKKWVDAAFAAAEKWADGDTCPNGHAMDSLLAGRDWECDGTRVRCCDKPLVARGARVRCCDACHYVVCSACLSRPRRKSKSQDTHFEIPYKQARDHALLLGECDKRLVTDCIRHMHKHMNIRIPRTLIKLYTVNNSPSS